MSDYSIEVDDEGVLTCPVCGYTNLHQEQTQVFNRDEDRDTPGVAIDESGQTFSLLESGRNPSARRGGVRIHFSCEQHEIPKLDLTIVQHKGTTYLAWEGCALQLSAHRRPLQGFGLTLSTGSSRSSPRRSRSRQRRKRCWSTSCTSQEGCSQAGGGAVPASRRRAVGGDCSGRASAGAGADVRRWSGTGERRPTRSAGSG